MAPMHTPSRTSTHTPLERLLSVPEAADILGVHRNTVWHLIADGELPAVRLGGRRPRSGRTLIEPAALRDHIAAHRTRGAS
jgi:excisionase family DNA binding protein